MRAAILAVVCVLGFTSTSAGQDPRGAIQGKVLDSSGGALPGTTVTVTNTANGTANTAVTDAEGRYSIPFITPGNYDVVVELTGFKRAERKTVEIRTADRLELDFSLEVGGLEETITVEGGTPLLADALRVAGTGHRREAHPVDAALRRQPLHAHAPGGGHGLHGRPQVLASVRQRGHLRGDVQRRGRRQRVHAGRLAQHGQRPARGVRPTGWCRAGVQGRDRDVRRSAGPHRWRDRQRDDEERHQHVPRRRLLPHSRREVQQERLLPRARRSAEGRTRLQAVRLHRGRSGGPRLLQRPQQDVLLHGRRVAVRHVPRARPVHGADRSPAQRRLLGAAAARHPDLRPGHRPARERTGPTHRVSRQHHPVQPHQLGGARDDEVLPAAQPGRQRAGPEQLPQHE